MCAGGYTKDLLVNDCLIMDTCKHNLISTGRLALTQDVGCWIAPGKGVSYFAFSSNDSDRVSLLNIGVLVLPDAAQGSI